MDSDQSPAKPKDLPEKVTLAWLFHHVPIQGWFAFAGLIMGAGLIGIGIGKSPLVTSYKCADPPAEVRITGPEHLSQTGSSVDVVGTQNYIANGSIWVAVFSYQVDRYFPHRLPAKIIGDTGWSNPDLQIIAPNGNTTKFDIVVFLVDDGGRNGLAEYFNSPDREGFRSPLPGMTEQDRVTVTSAPSP